MCLILDQFLWGHSSRVCDISCFLDWNKRKKSKKKYAELDRIHIKPKKVTKLARKSIHHDVLLWDKEIPPSDLNNFVRNEAEPRF